MDRSAINRALAKALAYKQCGNREKANEWATELVFLLECQDILAHFTRTHFVSPGQDD